MASSNLKGMVLAAGLGERLRPLTENCPKPLLPVAGRPMMEYPLRLLAGAGIREVVVNTHYLAEAIYRCVGDGERLGLEITYSHEPDILGTGGGIRKVESILSGGSFVVANSDVVIDLDLAEVIRLHRDKGAAATMVLRPDPRPEAWGAIEIDREGRVREFLGRLGWTGEPLEKLMFTGIHILEPRVFNYMPASRPFSITEVTYPAMLEAGEPVHGFTHHGYWSDLGTQERYRQTCEDLERGRVRLDYTVSEEPRNPGMKT